MTTRTTALRYGVRQLGWSALFLGILAALVFPAVLLSAANDHEITLFEQAGLILAATVAVQLLRRESLAAVTGTFEPRRLVEFAYGGLAGTALMIVPAFLLWCAGWVRFEVAGTQTGLLLNATVLMLGVALAEELLFRGVLFQRLVDGLGVWPTQLIIAALFALTHLGNPGMSGLTKILATANIFLASVMFGMTYLRTLSLAMPIGLHFMANVTQGIVLGFGVSGTNSSRLLVPIFDNSLPWLTGGEFGLEASLFGLVAVIATIVLIGRRWTQ